MITCLSVPLVEHYGNKNKNEQYFSSYRFLTVSPRYNQEAIVVLFSGNGFQVELSVIVFYSIHTFEARSCASSSCNVVLTAPRCFGSQGTHMPSEDFMKYSASWILRTGSKSTSLTYQ
jgi:hypothetical protein